MRISDWSSDVCSSDLPPGPAPSSLERHVAAFIPALAPKAMGNREKASHLHRLPWAPLPRQKALPHGPAQARPGKPFSQRLENYSTGKLLSDRKSTRLNSSH